MDVKRFEEIRYHPNVDIYIGDTLSLITITGGIIDENIPILMWLNQNFFTTVEPLLVGKFSRYSQDLDIKLLFFNE